MRTARKKHSGARVRTSTIAKASNIDMEGGFAGYAALWGAIDTFGDVMESGAFTASLQRRQAEGHMPALLWQHDPSQPIGAWIEMREDNRGLWCEGQLILDVERVREAHALLKAGALSGLSIGFECRVAEYAAPDDFEAKYGYGISASVNQVRILKEVDLWEVSLVTFPAHEGARVGTIKNPVGSRPDLSPLKTAIIRRETQLRRLARRIAAG